LEIWDRYGLWALEADGSVVSGFPKPTVAPNGSAMSSPAIADLDGIMEVVWIDAVGNVMVYEVPGNPGAEGARLADGASKPGTHERSACITVSARTAHSFALGIALSPLRS
jgi:hypothetical protein